MQPTLTFSFPWTISAADAINAVAAHFGATVSINGGAPQVPDHIKQAIERFGGGGSGFNHANGTAIAFGDGVNPASGTEVSAAIAFGGLMNGSAGNVLATSATAPSSADVATSTIAHAAQTGISQTSAHESSSNAPTVAPGSAATTAAPAPANAVEFDATGLAWDARIHSGKKSQTAAGEWRALKGVDKGLVKIVELELRAKYPNAPRGTTSSAPVGVGSTISAGASADPTAAEFVDQQARKRAALEFANNEAMRVAGPQQIDDSTLAKLLSGSPGQVTLTPAQNEWYAIYYAKRNAAYTEFMARPTAEPANIAQPVVPATPAVTPASGAGAELDATGLPFDARIHVPAKLKDSAGVWLQRHDVSGETKLAIMAELRGNVAAQASTAPIGANGSIPAVPAPPAAPVLATADEAKVDFLKLTQWIVGNQLAKRIGATDAADAAASLGFVGADNMGQLVLMREHSSMWPYVVQILQAKGAQ
jgi:hypothetical protein